MTKRMIQQRMLGSLRSSKMYKHSGVYISDFGKLLPFLHIIKTTINTKTPIQDTKIYYLYFL